MDEQPKEDAEQRPGLFKSANGLIAGLTGLLIAFGGLITAYRELQKPRNEAAAANADGSVAQQATNAPSDTGTADTQADEEPWGYTIDAGGTLRFKGGLWIETDAQGTETRYSPESVENGFTYAKDKGAGPDGEDVFLRWPTAGGQVEKSVDRQVTWNDVYVVTPEAQETTNTEEETTE